MECKRCPHVFKKGEGHYSLICGSICMKCFQERACAICVVRIDELKNTDFICSRKEIENEKRDH